MKDASAFSSALVAWFSKNARDLPWRRTRDPYAIWVSEVMLQQTQVKTVIPYWERWMNLFPRIEDLARASEERVLKAWEGLGYYRRARNLKKAAQQVVEKHQGIFPSKFEDVLALPGIGRYTAGAICSIAYGQPTPILDGNVQRVLSRVHLIGGEKELWQRATDLVQAASDCSALNQGLMELGATLCTPREPACPKCPWQDGCAARLAGRIAEFPPLAAKAKTRERRFVALILRRSNTVLIRQRAPDAVNGSLWEFPNFEAQRRPALPRQISEFLACPLELKPFATIRHTITNNRITLTAFHGAATASDLEAKLNGQWTPLKKINALPFSSAHAKLRQMLQASPDEKSPRTTKSKKD